MWGHLCSQGFSLLRQLGCSLDIFLKKLLVSGHRARFMDTAAGPSMEFAWIICLTCEQCEFLDSCPFYNLQKFGFVSRQLPLL